MKRFIYLCCIAHLLNEISARIRLTTPLPSSLRSNDDAASKDSKTADMIDFINRVLSNDGRSIVQSGRYVSLLRRYQIPDGINLLRNNEDMENKLEKLKDTVRFHVIDNPEVLEEFSKKQKRKKHATLMTPVPLKSDTSPEAMSFSTVENKLRYYHSKSNYTASYENTSNKKFDRLHHSSSLDGVQEFTTVESTYRPSFPDDDDDDDKVVDEDIEVKVTEKEINTLRLDEKIHDINTGNPPEVNNTVGIKKRTLRNEGSRKHDQVRYGKKKAHTGKTRETSQITNEFPLKTDKNNNGLTSNKEKYRINKENKSAKVDNNSNERLSEDIARLRDEYSKNDEDKHINGNSDTSSENNNKPEKGSEDTNEISNLPVERLMGIIKKSALRTPQENNNHDYSEQHSIYSNKDKNENNNQKFENTHEKRDKYDRKKRYKNEDNWSRKEKDWKKFDKQRYKKDNGNDRMEYEWNKRHQQYDDNDNLNVNDNQWDKNDDFNSRDRDSNKRDNDWENSDNDWDKRDNDWDKRDSDWKKRDHDWDKRDNDGSQRENYRNERDNDSKKRVTDWNKRDIGWIRKESKSPLDDRTKNDWDRKQHERENKYLEMSVKHDRYKVVGRKRKQDDSNRHSEV